MAEEVKNWAELAERLRLYANAVGALGGLNDLDKALLMAVEFIERFAPE